MNHARETSVWGRSAGGSKAQTNTLEERIQKLESEIKTLEIQQTLQKILQKIKDLEDQMKTLAEEQNYADVRIRRNEWNIREGDKFALGIADIQAKQIRALEEKRPLPYAPSPEESKLQRNSKIYYLDGIINTT